MFKHEDFERLVNTAMDDLLTTKDTWRTGLDMLAETAVRTTVSDASECGRMDVLSLIDFDDFPEDACCDRVADRGREFRKNVGETRCENTVTQMSTIIVNNDVVLLRLYQRTAKDTNRRRHGKRVNAEITRSHQVKIKIGEMYALSDGGEQLRQWDGEHQSTQQPPSTVSPPSGSVSLLNLRHPSNVVASFNHVQSLAVGVSRLVIGSLCLIFNIVNICFIDQVGWVVYITGNGFWAGCMCLVSGSFCVAASRNKTRLLIAGCLLADMFTSFVALQQLIVGVRGAVWATHLCTYQRLINEDDTCFVGQVTTAMEACLAAVAVLAIIASLWSLVLSCRALNCCAQVSVSQFGSISSGGGRRRDVSTGSVEAGTTTSSVVYHQGTDDVTTSSRADRNSRYTALY